MCTVTSGDGRRQSFTVPAGVTQVRALLTGAERRHRRVARAGGATPTVTPGQVLEVVVGNQSGFNGGGAGGSGYGFASGGSGGGASDVRSGLLRDDVDLRAE